MSKSAEWSWRCEPLERCRPDDWLVKFLIALGKEGKGDLQGAMNYLGASIQSSDYKNWQPLFRLAQILERNGKNREACEFYHSVRIIRPDAAGAVNAKL